MDKQEAIKILKNFHDTSALFSVRTALETVFPELKEDEDERIRKELITHCRNTRCVTEEGAERIAKWIAWLEKQGGQEPIEWKDSDEKYLFWALLSIQKDIAASEINGVNTKDLNDCVKWLYSIKRRIKGE